MIIGEMTRVRAGFSCSDRLSPQLFPQIDHSDPALFVYFIVVFNLFYSNTSTRRERYL